MDQLNLLKNELNELKNVYMEKQRESKSWDKKLILLIEMKKEIKNKEGDLGDIDIMKNEIHRMQVKIIMDKWFLVYLFLCILHICFTLFLYIYSIDKRVSIEKNIGKNNVGFRSLHIKT